MSLHAREPEYSPGPLTPSGPELLAWLAVAADDGSGAERWFRLPVHVCFDDEYRLGLGEAAVVAGADRVPVVLDGTRMSLSLMGELMFRVPPPERCGEVWMEGEWVSSGDDPTFVVRRVGPVVDASEDVRPWVGELPS